MSSLTTTRLLPYEADLLLDRKNALVLTCVRCSQHLIPTHGADYYIVCACRDSSSVAVKLLDAAERTLQVRAGNASRYRISVVRPEHLPYYRKKGSSEHSATQADDHSDLSDM